VVENVGDASIISSQSLLETLRRALRDSGSLTSQSTRGMSLVDGQGTTKVCATLFGNVPRLRALGVHTPTKSAQCDRAPAQTLHATVMADLPRGQAVHRWPGRRPASDGRHGDKVAQPRKLALGKFLSHFGSAETGKRGSWSNRSLERRKTAPVRTAEPNPSALSMKKSGEVNERFAPFSSG
jgi:hypothetical protein